MIYHYRRILGVQVSLLLRLSSSPSQAWHLNPFSSVTAKFNNHSTTLRSKTSTTTTIVNMEQPTLAEFLQSATAKTVQVSSAPDKTPTTLNFVIGNPAGDADSMISAISLAYLDTLLQDSKNDNNKQSSSLCFIPIISIPKRDLQTQRPETTFLLQLAGISPDLLLYIDTLISIQSCKDQTQQQQQQQLVLTLVDHNRVLPNSLLFDNWKVVEILDHHLDEQYHLDSCPPGKRNIAFENEQALVASTCTLVVERYLEANLSSNAPPNFSTPIAILLLGVILLDSVNLLPKAGKVTPRDVAAVEALLKHADWTQLSKQKGYESIMDPITQQPDLNKLFDTLQAQKFDPNFWKGLSVSDALRLDYKSFTGGTTEFGMSSVLQSMADFLSKNDNDNAAIQQEIAAFCSTQSIELLAIMFAVANSSGQLERELILCGTNQSLVQDMVSYMLQSDQLELKQQKNEQFSDTLSNNKKLLMYTFQQGNAKASRKQVAPIMIDYWNK